MTSVQQSLFKKSSKTFYYSTLFFPKHIQRDIFKLYAFVRTADDYVDSIPQNSNAFFAFKKTALYHIDNMDIISENEIIAGFIEVYQKYNFQREWVVSFLGAMESDLSQVYISSKQELEDYMYGSAAVVGYMMCALFSVRDSESLLAAKMLAYSMQCINFVRDIGEDNEFNRRYLYDTAGAEYSGLVLQDNQVHSFVHAHIKNYYLYLEQAQVGLYNLPLLLRVPVLTASHMYQWTAKEIQKNPSIIFQKKVKPTKTRVIVRAVYNFMRESIRSLSTFISQ